MRSIFRERAILALIILFHIVFSLGITPLQVLYYVELLSLEMRAKGTAFDSLVVSAASLMNSLAWPVALDKLDLKVYLVLMCWCLTQAAIIYLVIPETKGRTVRLFQAVLSGGLTV